MDHAGSMSLDDLQHQWLLTSDLPQSRCSIGISR
jgi:hypothetical protein